MWKNIIPMLSRTILLLFHITNIAGYIFYMIYFKCGGAPTLAGCYQHIKSESKGKANHLFITLSFTHVIISEDWENSWLRLMQYFSVIYDRTNEESVWLGKTMRIFVRACVSTDWFQWYGGWTPFTYTGSPMYLRVLWIMWDSKSFAFTLTGYYTLLNNSICYWTARR